MSKLLMNQLAATNMVYGRFSFEYFIESMKRLGVKNIELYACSGHYHFWDSLEDPTPRVKKQLRQAGLKVISLMPEENVYPVNIAAKEPELRNKTVDLYKRLISAAVELECPQMLLCPGRPYHNQPFSESWKYAQDSVARLTAHAEREGINLMYENLNIKESLLATNRFDQFRMVQEIGSPNLKCCVDTVPVAAAGEKLADYFSLMGEKLAHIHLNDGRPTGHMKWGDGTQDLDEHLDAMRQYGYSGYITMEMAAGMYMTDPEPHYAKNIETLRAHFDGGEL